jgi:hypothetical protein
VLESPCVMPQVVIGAKTGNDAVVHHCKKRESEIMDTVVSVRDRGRKAHRHGAERVPMRQ